MAITTLAQINSGQLFPRNINKTPGSQASGNIITTWAIGGSPAAGSFNNTLNGVTLDSTSAQVTGQIPFYSPASGNVYLSRMEVNALPGGFIVLCDRLWHNGGMDVTSTSAQNITSPTWPARDIAGTTNGDGVLLALEISAAVGAGTPNITISYTNSAGTASRTANNINATLTSSATQLVYLIGLQAGDTGVRSVQSLTLDATWTSGTMNLVAYREIARLEMKNPPSYTYLIDGISSGLPIMYNGSVPFIMMSTNLTTSNAFVGLVQFTAG